MLTSCVTLIQRLGCAVITCILSFVLYNIIEKHQYKTELRAPIINDVFEEHRRQTHTTIYEMHELFLTFTNNNSRKEDQIIFYTINGSDPRINGSDPRINGIPYDDNEESEIGIAIPISKVNDVHAPVIVSAVIGYLGSFDQIIWSQIANRTFWNPNHLNHSNYGGGFHQIPHIISGTHTIGYSFVVRVHPQRITDMVKCVYSDNNQAKRLTNKKAFWSDQYASKTMNISTVPSLKDTHFDFVFDDKYFRRWNGLIYVRCSTSSKSVSKTINHPDYSSMLMPTKPKHTQLFPPKLHRLGRIVKP
eukprot:523507_1